MAVQTATN